MSESWNPGEREMTPESALLSRRRWLKRAGLIGVPALAAGAGFWWWFRGTDQDVVNRGAYPGPGADLYPARRNTDFKEVDREISPETPVARYCNFYEFSKNKQVWRYVEPFQPVPWQLEITGLVAQPKTYDQDTLVRAFPLEERVYRHRCVEAWAMVVPWTGFALAKMIRAAGPLPEAKFVRFVSFDRPQEASRQASRLEPWPYTEGLTLAEATNELAFIATGMYGHPLLKQHGAPVRLVVIWLQERQVDRAHRADGRETGHLLEYARSLGVRFPGECKSGSASPALESGTRKDARHRRGLRDADLQRLRGVGRGAV